MTEQERSRAKEVISRKIKTGWLMLNHLTLELEQNGISRSIYEGSKPKKWLLDHFPEFYIEGDPGKEIIRLVEKDDLKMTAALALQQELAKGPILMSSLPATLENYREDLSYRDYTGGKKLFDWLMESFPGAVVSEDHMYLRSLPRMAYAKELAREEETPVSQSEVDQMHLFAYMGWWSNLSKQLKNLGITNVQDELQYRNVIARQFARMLLGDSSVYLADRGEPFTLGLRTGLLLENGEELYCILGDNAGTADRELQPLVLQAFAAASDRTPQGEWLRRHIDRRKMAESTRTVLREELSALIEKRTQLTDAVQSLLEELRQGRIPALTENPDVRGLRDQWEKLQQACMETLKLPQSELGTPERVLEKLQEADPSPRIYREALTLFSDMTEQVHALFASYRFEMEEESTPLRDRKALLAVYGENTDIEQAATPDLFRETLKPYLVLLEVMSSSAALGMEEETILVSHFREIQRKFEIRILSGAEQEEWEFLQKAKEIAALLDQAEYPGEEAAVGEETFQLSDYRQAILAGKIRKREILSYTEAAYPEFRKTLLEGKGDGEHTLSEAAELALQRGQEEIAEFYALTALYLGEEGTAPILLSLYQKAGDTESYQKAYERFAGGKQHSLPEEVHYVRILSRRDPEEAISYAESHPYLLYVRDSVESLLSIDPAMLEDRRPSLRDRLSERVLWTLPLAEEISRSGQELYAEQGNEAHEAEALFWRAAAEGRQKNPELLRLLTEEERYEEGIALYEYLTFTYEEDASVKPLYLLSLLKADPEKAKQQMTENLTEWIRLFAVDKNLPAALAERIEKQGEAFPFLQDFQALSLLAEEELVRAVILMDRSLREYADPQNGQNLPLSESLRRALIQGYKTDSYAHGNDAVSVSQRLLSLIGNYKGAAELCVRLTLPAPAGLSQLWKIYEREGDTQALYRMMQTYPDLREAHRGTYLHMLFRNEQYQKYLREYREEEQNRYLTLEKDIAERMQGLPSAAAEEIIALLQEANTEEPKKLLQWIRQYGTRLTGALRQAEEQDGYQQLLLSFFPIWWEALEPDILKAVITADGAISEAWLLALEEQALTEDMRELAVYLYETFRVGALSELSKQYLSEAMAQAETMTGKEKLSALHRLSLLYTDDAGLRKKETEAELQLLLAEGDLTEEAVWNRLLSCVNQADLGEWGQQEMLLRLLEKAEQSEGQQGAVLTDRLCDYMLTLLLRDAFPETLSEQAKGFFENYRRNRNTKKGMLLLYLVVRKNGDPVYADYILRRLSDGNDENEEEQIRTAIAREIEARWNTEKHPSYFSLLQKVLADRGMREIMAFLEETSRLEPGSGQIRFPETQEDRLLSEEDCENIVLDLCQYPKDREVWSHAVQLPMEEAPHAYGMLQLLYCNFAPEYWKKCALFCEGYEENELLLSALLGWSLASANEQISALRQYLEKRLKQNPDFLQHWEDKEKINILVKNLMRRTAEDPKAKYYSLCSIAGIALAAGTKESLEGLLERFGEQLLGGQCDIGSAVAARLLLDGRISEAQQILRMLKQVLQHLNYEKLIQTLSEMPSETLAEWCAQEGNRLLLTVILPDGNSPSAATIQSITYTGIWEGKSQETASVLRKLLEILPEDYVLYQALYTLSTEQFPGYIPVLHQALLGLISSQPTENSQSYYRYNRLQHGHFLAVLDAVLVACEESALVPAYDFRKSTGEHYREAGGASAAPEEIAEINEEWNRVLTSFKNLGSYEKKRLREGYLALITGNWEVLLRSAWEDKQDISAELALSMQGGVGSTDLPAGLSGPKGLDLSQINMPGMARSVLRVLLSLPGEDRERFATWLSDMVLGNPEHAIRSYRMQISFALDFYRQGMLSELEEVPPQLPLDTLLRLPFEDYSLYKKFLSLVRKSVKEEYPHQYALNTLVDGLVCLPSFQSELGKLAEKAFLAGRDETARSFYGAMLAVAQQFRYTYLRGHFGADVTMRMREELEAKFRVSAAFAGDPAVLEKLASEELHPWSLINMILVLAYTERADEIERLTELTAPKQRVLAQSLQRALDPTVPDGDKLALIDRIEGLQAQAYFCYVVKYPFLPGGIRSQSFFLQDLATAEQINLRYMTITNSAEIRNTEGYQMAFAGAKAKRMLLLENGPANAAISRQKTRNAFAGTGESEGTEITESGLLSESASERLSFTDHLTPITERAEMGELLEKHDGILGLNQSIPEKLALSRQVLSHCLGGEYREISLREAELLYGGDLYQSLLSEQKTEEANAVLLELAKALRSTPSHGIGTKALQELIQNSAVFELLRTQGSLQALLALYTEQRGSLLYMRDLIRDGLQKSCVSDIYTVLEQLLTVYRQTLSGEIDSKRRALAEAYRELQRKSSNTRMYVRNAVQRLITEESNALNRRPELRVEILNQGAQRCFGSLFGVVANIGQIPAEQVMLQVHYSNDTVSHRYLIDRLAPGTKAAFEIHYGAAKDTVSLGYWLQLSFGFDGSESYTETAAEGTLAIQALEEPTYQDNLIVKDPNGMLFSPNPEKGDVENQNFFGRKQETRDLRALVEGPAFIEYQSALMYGIRRTGKSSLLNYLYAYIEAFKPNVLPIMVDCQQLKRVHAVHYVFIDSVIEGMETREPGLQEDAEWQTFRDSWYQSEESADRNPERISLFYTRLRPFLREKGIYLIVDETDRLFELVEERQSETGKNLESLFGGLSAILNSAACRQVIHLLICGSNWLIRYLTKGNAMNQLYQRFGNFIEVGKLPEKDAKEVITVPYRRSYPELTIPEETLNWIWDYIGGFVWHTKLLAKEAISRAKNDGRYAVYPSDVQQALAKVLTDQWCKQFYEGCDSGRERSIIDAMQSMACRRDQYLSVSRIAELLKWEVMEVERGMEVLKTLKVVEQSLQNPKLYRFEQDIYRRYFRTKTSVYEQAKEESDLFRDVQLSESSLKGRSNPEAGAKKAATGGIRFF